ncbi:MAG: hypothetical protein HY097_09915 [Nitrospinae bacterium]|nr:hypothetical protein [Nitrospinota bacterium]MBI3815464.1 hypothetical protein [Nitrospinota bacterium]
MEIKNNFISIITLGNFNPAILTPDFLWNNCKFTFIPNQTPKGQMSPIVSNLEFGNISFLMELEKFQIMEKEPHAFKDTKIINVMETYLNILAFTPIFVMGANFNVKIERANEKAISNLNNKDYLLTVFNTNEFIYSSKIKYSKNSIIDYLSWELINSEESITRVNINLKGNIFTLNYNVEIRDIMNEKRKISYFSENLDSINNKFQNALKEIF